RAHYEPALPRGGRAPALVHAAGGARTADSGYRRGACVPPEVPAARILPRRVHPADDGHPGRYRAGVDDDVPPTAGRAQLSAVARGHRAERVGVFAKPRDPLPRVGRHLAGDAPRHAERAWRSRVAPYGPVRGGVSRRRHALADVPPRHAADAAALHHGRRRRAPYRRAQDLRHDLRDYARGAGYVVGDDQSLPLPPGVLVLPGGQGVGGSGGLLRARRWAVADAVLAARA